MNDKDVMIEIKVQLLRDGTQESSYSYPTEEVSVPAILIIGMLTSATHAVITHHIRTGPA